MFNIIPRSRLLNYITRTDPFTNVDEWFNGTGNSFPDQG